MTEQEWLTTDDLHRMLAYLKGDLYHWHMPDAPPKASDRKMRLYACACCRRLWDRFDSDCRHVVEIAEHCADGLVDEELLCCWREWAMDRLYHELTPLARVDLRLMDWDNASEADDAYLRQCGFKPETARAIYAATWPVAAIVETVSKVWPKLKTDGRDLGTTYAPEAIARTLAGVFPRAKSSYFPENSTSIRSRTRWSRRAWNCLVGRLVFRRVSFFRIEMARRRSRTMFAGP